MLTEQLNASFTRVGPGTPAGELLRRYWHPAAPAHVLTPDNPTAFVRMLGEDLVLFRDQSGRVGLLADHCSHRGASLVYGRVEPRGLACAYHGWLYDTEGNCLETPAEPAHSNFHLTVKHRAYPVQEFMSLYWAYLGPQPAPVIPKYDVWVRRDGRRRISLQPMLDCNWFQAMENAVDPAHLLILHQESRSKPLENTPRGPGRQVGGLPPPENTTRGLIDAVDSHDFYMVPYGIMKRREYKDGVVDEHPLIFPNVLRNDNGSQIRVPIDDAHTQIYSVRFEPTLDGSEVNAPTEIPPVRTAYKDPASGLHPATHFTMQHVLAQDFMAWETQGPIADRSGERLATSDYGILLLRKVMEEQLDRAREGLDPIGVIRDPDHEMIDTGLNASIEEMLAHGETRTDGNYLVRRGG